MIHIYIYICILIFVTEQPNTVNKHCMSSVGVCVDDGWFKQPDLAGSDWTLGLVEAAHLLHTE